LPAGGDGVGEIGQTSGLAIGLAIKLGARNRVSAAQDKALEAVFDSLGRACVLHLVAVPHPFGLPPRDRLVAQRWLSRGSVRQWTRDLAIVLGLVGLGLAGALVVLGLYGAPEPRSDAVQKSTPMVTLRG
jgi:hypothetical protein